MLLPGKSHGRRSLVGCSPWGHEESDTTERLHFHFSLSCIGERNGNPLQCSCLENPRDSGAWWAAVYGVAQSQTRLKWLSSSSSSSLWKTRNPWNSTKVILQPWNQKTIASWQESDDKPRQCVEKKRHYSANKGPYSQAYGRPSGHVRLRAGT